MRIPVGATFVPYSKHPKYRVVKTYRGRQTMVVSLARRTKDALKLANGITSGRQWKKFRRTLPKNFREFLTGRRVYTEAAETNAEA